MQQFQPHRNLSLISLIEAVADESGVSRAETGKVIRTTLDVIARTVSSLYEVRLTNFGTFAARVVAARTWRNPQTGAGVPVGDHLIPKFRARGKFYDGMVRGDAVDTVRKDPKSY
jgi:DNA-binding protein HU-beta